MSEELKKVIVSTGIVCKAVLSDEDSRLKKASRLLHLPHLSDICHATGTCLKKVFDKNEDYQQLMKLIDGYRHKGVNQDLSYLLPPKQRSKARFLNLVDSVKWANKMLVNFKKLSPKELKFFEQLPKYKSIIGHLWDCIEAAKELTLNLKEQGISDRILKQSMEAIEQKQQSAQQQNKDFLAQFLKYLSAYFAQYQFFIEEHGEQNIPVSSEIIESLLGVYKNLASTNQLAGATYLNFELDVRCIAQQTVDEKLKEALEGIFMTDLEQWKNNQKTDNQLIKRRDWFKNRN